MCAPFEGCLYKFYFGECSAQTLVPHGWRIHVSQKKLKINYFQNGHIAEGSEISVFRGAQAYSE
jgi:hypothetical protein